MQMVGIQAESEQKILLDTIGALHLQVCILLRHGISNSDLFTEVVKLYHCL